MGSPIVQGDVLEWAISDAGIDRARLVASLEASDKLSNPASGPIRISEDDLKVIAEATKRSLYFFALPEPPKPSKTSVAANFRAPASNNGQARNLTPDERVAVRHAKRRQDIAAKLATKLNEEPVELLSLPSSDSPEAAAERVSEWLKWDFNTQRRELNSKNKVFVALRAAVEDHGIITNLVKIEGDSFRGFALHHRYAPLIFINAALKSPAARSFTLLHELAHLLRGVDKACSRHDLQARTADEAWCNRFAAAFLMPADDVRTYLGKYRKTSFVSDVDTLRLVSNYFRTSHFAAAIRLKQLGLANESLVRAVSGDYQEEEQQGRAPGKTRPELRLVEYGAGFARLVGHGISQSRVSELEARKLFRVEDSDELRTLMRLGQVSA